MNQQLWEKCVAFHGHECPGLAIGFRASQIAMERLDEQMSASSDEEVVCVTENDTCGVDAVQFLTGCTIGKGNLIYRPTGKMAFSFFCRKSGKKIRIILKPESGRDKGRDLSRDEWRLRLLEAPAEDVFIIKEPKFDLPERTRSFGNEVCEVCGESAPEHMIRLQEGKKVCLDCYKGYTRGW